MQDAQDPRRQWAPGAALNNPVHLCAVHKGMMGKGGSVAADERVEVINNAIRVIPDFPKVWCLGHPDLVWRAI